MRRLVLFLAALAAGCSTAGPDESLRTLLVRFAESPTSADLTALRNVGGSIQHRLELDRSVSLRTPLTPDAYVSLAGIDTVMDLGAEEDPSVSVFIKVVDAPTNADEVFVLARGATYIFSDADDRVIATIMPLSRVPELESRDRFIGLEVALEPMYLE